MIALTTTLAVHVKCSRQCLANYNHLENGRCVIVTAIVITPIFPEAKTSQNLEIIQVMNELS